MEIPDVHQLLKEIESKRNIYQLGGGQGEVAKQHKKGKLTARERLNLLFDDGTFQELNLWALPFRTGYEIDEKFSPGDAVVTGYGKVDGRTVMAYAHDFTVLAGTQSTGQHAKINRIMEGAVKAGVPYVGIADSAGVRLQDGMGQPGVRPPSDGIGLHGSGSYMYSPPQASGVVPQIAVMLGPQFAGSSYSPILKDFLIMREGNSYACLASPPVIKTITGLDVTVEELGGAMVHAKITGTCDKVVKSDEESMRFCRKLLSYWPPNWREKPPTIDMGDSPYRRDEGLLDIVPGDLTKGYDMHKLIAMLVDQGEFTETKEQYAPSIITGFARIGGQSIGIIANNPAFDLGALNMDTSDKAARFIRFCDAFNIPLVFLADTIGFLPDPQKQAMGVERHAAKSVYAICEATVPKITVYIRNCSNWGELAMGTEQMGADLVVAWPHAQIGIVDAKNASNQFYVQDKGHEDLEKVIAEYNNLYHAGSRNLFNDIIDPRETRATIHRALTWLDKKSEKRPWKKHDNMPL
jgi:Acetyl-CoA carboxylase, carboxyltransferase component (subunits alpha and beta)